MILAEILRFQAFTDGLHGSDVIWTAAELQNHSVQSLRALDFRDDVEDKPVRGWKEQAYDFGIR